MSASAVARGITLAVSPILTRIYSPADFALLALMVALSRILYQVSAFSYNQAIVVAESDKDSAALFGLSTALVLLVTMLTAACIIPFRFEIGEAFGNAHFAYWAWVLPVLVFTRGVGSATAQFAITRDAFRLVGVVAIVEAVLAATAKIAIGLSVGPAPGSLLAGACFAFAAGTILLFVSSRSIARIRELRLRMLTDVARRYADFPKYNLWTVLLNATMANINVLFFSAAFTPKIVGSYSLAWRTANLPVQYLGSSLQSVYLRHASENRQQGRALRGDFLKTTAALALVGIIPTCLLIAWGEEIFLLVFGSDWGIAGRFVEIAAPGLFFQLLNRPANVIMTVLRQLRWRMIYTTIYMVARVLALVVAYFLFKDPYACLQAYVLTVVAFNVVLIARAHLVAKRGDLQLGESSPLEDQRA